PPRPCWPREIRRRIPRRRQRGEVRPAAPMRACRGPQVEAKPRAYLSLRIGAPEQRKGETVMKRALFTAVAAIALTMCASAFAQDTSTVTQNGNGDNAAVDQTAAAGVTTSTVTQSSDNQYANV